MSARALESSVEDFSSIEKLNCAEINRGREIFLLAKEKHADDERVDTCVWVGWIFLRASP